MTTQDVREHLRKRDEEIRRQREQLFPSLAAPKRRVVVVKAEYECESPTFCDGTPNDCWACTFGRAR